MPLPHWWKLEMVAKLASMVPPLYRARNGCAGRPLEREREDTPVVRHALL